MVVSSSPESARITSRPGFQPLLRSFTSVAITIETSNLLSTAPRPKT